VGWGGVVWEEGRDLKVFTVALLTRSIAEAVKEREKSKGRKGGTIQLARDGRTRGRAGATHPLIPLLVLAEGISPKKRKGVICSREGGDS